MGGEYADVMELHERSGWSDTQTITVNPSSPITLDLPDDQAFVLSGALILIPLVAGLGFLIFLSKKTR